MSTASQVAASLLQAYKTAQSLQQQHKKLKADALRSNPKYRVFDIEHPYFDIEPLTIDAVKHIKQSIKVMMDVDIEGSSVRKEWEKMKVMAALSSKPLDADVESLLRL